MRKRRTKLESPSTTYLEKVSAFSSRDAELLALRIGGRFTRRVADKSRSTAETVALQLAFEDTQLSEWRERLARIRGQEKAPA